MYKVLSKDTIENEIIPYLSVAKRGYKTVLDLSSADIDGSHTPSLRGGEEVAYQGRKSKKQLMQYI